MCILLIEREMGFEPTTLWLVTRCSTTELLSHWAKNQNRTDNLFITSEVLYQLSYFSILRWHRLPSRDWYHYVTSYFYSDFLSRLRVSNSPPKIGSLPCHQQHLVCIFRRKTVTATSRFFLLLLTEAKCGSTLINTWAFDRIRTYDPFITSEVHYQLCYKGILLEGRDSNPRTLTRTDLQSVAFNHSATLQNLIFIFPIEKPMTG